MQAARVALRHKKKPPTHRISAADFCQKMPEREWRRINKGLTVSRKQPPQRSCVVCRDKLDKRSLTRLVVVDKRLRIDKSGKMNGRGAYLCGKANCWQAAAARPILDMALRQTLCDDDRSYLRRMKPA